MNRQSKTKPQNALYSAAIRFSNSAISMYRQAAIKLMIVLFLFTAAHFTSSWLAQIILSSKQ